MAAGGGSFQFNSLQLNVVTLFVGSDYHPCSSRAYWQTQERSCPLHLQLLFFMHFLIIHYFV